MSKLKDSNRIKNNDDFYDKLHAMEDFDPEWFLHIGTETVRNSNQYAGAGKFDKRFSAKQNAKHTLKLRSMLQDVRQALHQSEVEQQHPWRTGAQRDSIRLKVTIYRSFGLSYPEIGRIIGEKPSTIRHSYTPFKKGEKLKNDYRLILRDHNGRHVVKE